jgi:hypothetical protein
VVSNRKRFCRFVLLPHDTPSSLCAESAKEQLMLSLKECFDFCGLTGDEVHAIAEHEHLTELSAAVRGQSLLQTEQGISEITRFMREDIESAKSRGRHHTAQEFAKVLAHFEETHHS